MTDVTKLAQEAARELPYSEDFQLHAVKVIARHFSPALTALREENERLKAERASSLDRDYLGQIVRMAWVAWAQKQPSPKPSWLVPWSELNEVDREADRCIGEAVAKVCVTPELLKVEQRAEAAEAERDRLRERVEAVARELESLGKRSTDYDYAARQLRAALTPPASGKEV